LEAKVGKNFAGIICLLLCIIFELFDSISEVIDSNSEVIDSNSEVFDSISEVLDSISEALDSISEVIDSNPEVLDSNSEVLDSISVLMSSCAGNSLKKPYFGENEKLIFDEGRKFVEALSTHIIYQKTKKPDILLPGSFVLAMIY
jgi:hypothetical protein